MCTAKQDGRFNSFVWKKGNERCGGDFLATIGQPGTRKLRRVGSLCRIVSKLNKYARPRWKQGNLFGGLLSFRCSSKPMNHFLPLHLSLCYRRWRIWSRFVFEGQPNLGIAWLTGERMAEPPLVSLDRKENSVVPNLTTHIGIRPIHFSTWGQSLLSNAVVVSKRN